jgi:hypothetical protein
MIIGQDLDVGGNGIFRTILAFTWRNWGVLGKFSKESWWPRLDPNLVINAELYLLRYNFV